MNWRTNKMSEDESSSPNFFREDEQGDAFMIINGVEFPLIKEDGKILALTMLDPLRKEPISIEQRKLPKTLNKWGFKITDKLSDVEKFKKVIEAVAIVSSEDDETGDRWGRKIERTGDHGYKKMGLLSWDQMRKYLAVAVKAKLISEDKVPKRLAPAPTDIGKIKDKPTRKMEKNIQAFINNPDVMKWQGYTIDEATGKKRSFEGKFKDKGVPPARTLWKAFTLLDMTPEQFLKASTDPAHDFNTYRPSEKIDILTKRLEEPTFQAGGEDAKVWTEPMSLYEWAMKRDVPIHDKKNVKFSRARRYNFQEGSTGVLKEMTKFMRHFLEVHGITGAYPKIWSQKTPKSKYGALDMSVKEIERFEECLLSQTPLKFTETEDRLEKVAKKEFVNGDGKIYKKGEWFNRITVWETEKEDWDVAFLYYKIAMDIGWRAEEAFTSVANKPKDQKTDSGVMEMGEAEEFGTETGQLIVQIMTRKSARAGRAVHMGSIVTEDTKALIRKKVEHVEKAMKLTYKQAEKMGVIKEYTDYSVEILAGGRIVKSKTYGQKIPNHHHALIGRDGQYTKVGTMAYPSKAKLTPDERKKFNAEGWEQPQVAPVVDPRSMLRAIMRQCYEKAFGKKIYDNYFKTNSLHALRHLFAQYWLKATDKDFSLVQDVGHWGGIDVLKQFYGQSSKSENLRKLISAKKSLKDLEAMEEKLQTKKQQEADEKINKQMDLEDEEDAKEIEQTQKEKEKEELEAEEQGAKETGEVIVEEDEEET